MPIRKSTRKTTRRTTRSRPTKGSAEAKALMAKVRAAKRH